MPCSRVGGRTLPWGWAHDVQAVRVTHGIRVPPAKLVAQAQGAGHVGGAKRHLTLISRRVHATVRSHPWCSTPVASAAPAARPQPLRATCFDRFTQA